MLDDISPLTVFMAALLIWLVSKLLTPATDYSSVQVLDAPTPVAQRDYTLEELRPFNGVDEKRILVAINGKVYEVSSKRNFYGPGGPYALFAGRDASRALAKGDLSPIPEGWDELDNLTSDERAQLNEWEESFSGKYNVVGRLVREHPPPEAASPTLSTSSGTWEMVDGDEVPANSQ